MLGVWLIIWIIHQEHWMKLLKRKSGIDLLKYLLLAVLAIIVYAEVLPTISMVFELIRTWLADKITIVQQHTIHAQEDIQDTQSRLEKSNTHAIGFQMTNNEEDYYEYEED